MTDKQYKKKLIEVALPLEAINAASAREKSIRHGHPSTLHLWWARRPLAACRAILFAQLVDDPSEHVDELLADANFRKRAEDELHKRHTSTENSDDHANPNSPLNLTSTLEGCAIDIERRRLFQLIEELVKWENSSNKGLLERARTEIRKSCDGELPAIYDPFSGGGSIPLESQRLGLPAYGSDLNPVAALLGKAMVEIPLEFKHNKPAHPGTKAQLHYQGAQGLAEDIKWYAQVLNDKAWKNIGHLYPQIRLSEKDGGTETTVLAWLWARTVPSPNPAMRGKHIPLVSSFWLCKKANKPAYVEPITHGSEITFEVRYGKPKDPDRVSNGTKSGRGANFYCLLTGDAVTAEYVKSQGMAGHYGWRLMAIVAEGQKGRAYVSPTEEHEALAFSERPSWRPEFPLSKHPQYMSVTKYGPDTIADLFMPRQTIALDTFGKLIKEVVEEIDATEEYRAAIATYLALSVSRLANRQSTNTFWDNGAENIQQVFAMQALPMRWDTAEGNPFSSSSGNFMGQVEYLCKNIASLSTEGGKACVTQQDARIVDFSNCVVSTDPPYYDNVPYSDLSDFFYVWLKRSLKDYFPRYFSTMLTPKSDELVADYKRHDGRERADSFFLKGMKTVLTNMANQSRQDIPAAIYYAFRQGEVEEEGVSSKGWATFLEAVIGAGYQIVSTWPVRTELVGNLKKNKNVLATSVVMACRRRDTSHGSVSRIEFVRALKKELPTALREMQRASIAPVDIPQASIGPGISIFSRYEAVIESDDSYMSVKTALQIINRELDEFLTEQEGEFDSETRFGISWYTQHGYDSGAFGDADNLARARGIGVDDVRDAGFVESSAGKVRILKRDELDPDWDPATDKHLTVWECCQHLIRELETRGEPYAAKILKRMGPEKAESVKDLAYCLFDVASNKRKDAREASSYNALIAVWAELTRQAGALEASGTDEQASLNF